MTPDFRNLREDATEILGRIRNAAGEAGDRTTRIWKPERAEDILRDQPLFDPLPEGMEPDIRNALWRAEAIMVAGVALGSVLEDDLTRLTRRLFHDQLTHRDLSTRLFGADYSEIHRWMDTVPGSKVAGGGILHRLQHGHDFAGLREVHEAHGWPGAFVWMQHNAQDMTTPTGVPLPMGSGKAADWLVANGHLTSGKAALAVSFNVVELASAFLAGAAAMRLANLVAEIHRARRIRRRCRRARRFLEEGDLEGAIANYREAYALSDGSPAIALGLGWCYARSARPRAESFLAFREAAQGLAADDVTMEFGGAHVSLRGFAYLLALAQAPQILDEDHMRGTWRDELEQMWRGAVVSFERTAIAQVEPPALHVGPVDVEWRARPLSAAVNYYLAGRVVAAIPFLPQGDLLRLARNAQRSLPEGTENTDVRDRLVEIKSRWAYELRPRNKDQILLEPSESA